MELKSFDEFNELTEENSVNEAKTDFMLTFGKGTEFWLKGIKDDDKRELAGTSLYDKISKILDDTTKLNPDVKFKSVVITVK